MENNPKAKKILDLSIYVSPCKDKIEKKATWSFDEKNNLKGSVVVNPIGFFKGVVRKDEKSFLAFGVYHEDDVAEVVLVPTISPKKEGTLAFNGKKGNLGFSGLYSIIALEDEYFLGNSMLNFKPSKAKEKDVEEMINGLDELDPTGMDLYLDSLAMQDVLSKVIRESYHKDEEYTTYLGLFSESQYLITKDMELKK